MKAYADTCAPRDTPFSIYSPSGDMYTTKNCRKHIHLRQFFLFDLVVVIVFAVKAFAQLVKYELICEFAHFLGRFVKRRRRKLLRQFT